MSRLFGGASTTSHSLKIKPDDNHLMLRGHAGTAPQVVLKGTVVLSSKEPVRAQAVRLSLTGKLRAGYLSSANAAIKHDEQFLCETKALYSPTGKQSSTLASGCYEWPFEFIIDGSQPETLEGLEHSWIAYRLKAVVDRGLLLKDLVERVPIRLIRTYDPAQETLFQESIIDSLWPEKIKYTLSLPSRGIFYGSAFSVNLALIPLLKGLRIGHIKTQLWEEHKFSMPTTNAIPRPHKHDAEVQMVCEDVYEIPEGTETQDIDGMEGYEVERVVALPKNLKSCRQHLETSYLRIEHNVRFIVALLNPAGHTSELRCKLPVTLIMPTFTRYNDSSEIVSEIPANNTLTVAATAAPPGYGQHLYDQIFNDIDVQHLMTPATSTPATPFQGLSRSGSTADLAALGSADDNQVSANTLSNRLSTIGRNRGSASDELEHSRNDSGVSNDLNTSPEPGNSSYRLGEQGAPETPEEEEAMHIEFNTEAMSRVPSYRTAIRSNTHTPWSADLPSYNTATSRPQTPQTNEAARTHTSPNEGSGEISEGSRSGGNRRRVHYSADTQGSDE